MEGKERGRRRVEGGGAQVTGSKETVAGFETISPGSGVNVGRKKRREKFPGIFHELVLDLWLSSLVFKWIKPRSRQGSNFSRVSVWEFLARLHYYHGDVRSQSAGHVLVIVLLLGGCLTSYYRHRVATIQYGFIVSPVYRSVEVTVCGGHGTGRLRPVNNNRLFISGSSCRKSQGRFIGTMNMRISSIIRAFHQ